MNTQIFRSWSQPSSPSYGRVSFEGITYGNGMQIALREVEGTRRRFYLDFRELPAAIRIANESMRLASLQLVPKKIETSFFLIENSKFLAWLNQESLDIYENDPLFHLAIVTEEWIDIICNENPTIVIGVVS